MRTHRILGFLGNLRVLLFIQGMIVGMALLVLCDALRHERSWSATIPAAATIVAFGFNAVITAVRLQEVPRDG